MTPVNTYRVASTRDRIHLIRPASTLPTVMTSREQPAPFIKYVAVRASRNNMYTPEIMGPM